MESLNILYCLRRDAHTKPGGDSGKVEKYIKELSKINIKANIVTNPSQLSQLTSDPTLVHIFNTQTPYENIPYYKWAKRRKIPIYFSTIHHQEKFMEMYFKTSKIGRFLNYEMHSWLTSLAREILVYRSIRNLTNFSRLPKSINRKIIENSESIFPLSTSELEHLETDHAIRIPKEKVTIIPNGQTFTSPTEQLTRDIDILVVGRIEPRKNQLKIAQALSKSNYTVCFAGQENTNHTTYVRDFKDTVNSSKNISFIGKQNQDQLKELYTKSRINLSNSWFEVVSQVDLEATALGCKPIVSEAGAILDYFSPAPITLSPNCSEQEILDAVNSAALPTYSPKIREDYFFEWSSIVEKILHIYRKADAL